MTQHEIYFLLGIAILFFFGWLITCHLYSLRVDENKDLQLENTDLINKVLDLQIDVNNADKENQKLHSQLDNTNSMLAKKKELLTIQDGIIKDLKHNQPQED